MYPAGHIAYNHIGRNVVNITKKMTIINGKPWIIISIHPLISNSSSPLSNPLEDHSKCTNYTYYRRHPLCSTICIFSSHARSKYLSIFSLSFIFHSVVSSVYYTVSSFALFIATMSGLLVAIWWFLWISISREFYTFYFLGQTGFVHIPFVSVVKMHSFYNSQAITSFTHLCLIDFVVLFLLSLLE